VVQSTNRLAVYRPTRLSYSRKVNSEGTVRRKWFFISEDVGESVSPRKLFPQGE